MNKTKLSSGLLLVAILASSAFAQNAAKAAKTDNPKLVVGIVVDQMRYDYLYKYQNRYGNGGFKRMLKEGFSNENTNIAYIPSVTAIGHTTAYTGAVPATHGIAGNDFILRETEEAMYCTRDDSVFSVGSADKNNKAGKMSPKNVIATTITDELELATNFKSKVIGIALKDRGSIIPAGHAADAAYWYDGATGDFITSSWYRNDLPEWLVDFNKKKRYASYLSQGWKPLYPIETYTLSEADLPFSLPPEPKPGDINATPFGNSLTLELARLAIDKENLGKNSVPDFLAVSLSSTDYVGHTFSPNSMQVEDTYLRLDKDLADFLTYLDAKIGKGKYLLFLTADHAAPHSAAFLSKHKIPSGGWNEEAKLSALNANLKSIFNADSLALSLNNNQVTFSWKRANAAKIENTKLLNAAVDFLKKQSEVVNAFPFENALFAPVPKNIREMAVNGYYYGRSGDIQIILKPAFYKSSYLPHGTTHSAPYSYDTQIPLVWFGWGIKAGKSSKEVFNSDIAPTLAAMLHLQKPSGNVGKAIEEVLK